MFGITLGGGIASSSSAPLVINNSYITSNISDGFDQPGYGGGLYLANSNSLTITGSHIDNNKVWGGGSANGSNAGGGIYYVPNTGSAATVSITGSTLNGNSGSGSNASGVGALFSPGGATGSSLSITIDKTSINGNTGSGFGIGIFAGTTRGALSFEMKNSTLANNTGGNIGGGISFTNNGGNASATIFANLKNSTISGNSVVNRGGGLSAQQVPAAVEVTLDYCTVTNNSAGAAGGLDNFSGPATMKIFRSVIAGNTAPTGPDIWFSAVSLDYNHIGDLTGATITGTTTHNTTGDAMLGALADNGGTTLTHRPAIDSPVINTIVGSGVCGANGENTDQRGILRPQGAACDKGSVEANFGPYDISGTVRTFNGLPIRNATVVLEGGNLPMPIFTVTGNLGIYLFPDLAPGQYTVSISSKRFTFDPRPLNLQQDEATFDFTAEPEVTISRPDLPASGGILQLINAPRSKEKVSTDGHR
jgi:hypothetical protein